MSDWIPSGIDCCRRCGHVTYYTSGKARRYECENGKKVQADGVCDRFQPNISPAEIMRKMDREIKRLEKMGDGAYELKKRPPLGQNYRLIYEKGETEQ